jgi:ATP-dependent Zn protease
MDGFSVRNNIMIIGATNFLHSLDPAFIRPGRFDHILELDLPTKAVRIDILKLHCQRTARSARKGVDLLIPWNFFSNCTVDFSGADLAAIVNESLLKTIRETKNAHNVKTLQHGLDRISTCSKNFLTLCPKDLFFQTRASYYESGVALISFLLTKLKNPLALHLKKTTKKFKISKNRKKNRVFCL